MKTGILRALRIIAGFLLIGTVFPPLGLHVMNLFVLVLPALGALLLALPLVRAALRRVFGAHSRAAGRILLASAGAAGIYFAIVFGVIFFNSIAQQPPRGATVVVPGAKVIGSSPSLILLGRIVAAGEYLRAHPESVCIACGGQGADESMTEAACIRDYLVLHYGIEPGRIYLDETSADTAAGFDNAKAIIDQNGLSDRVAVATDGFHMFRSKLLAARRGMKPYALPAKTTRALVIELYVREMIGLPKAVLLNR